MKRNVPMSNVFARLDNEYYQLTGAEKKVADFVVSHEKQTQFMSISELAEECGVAEATISRFCRRMGYKGYSAFKLAVANCTAGASGAGLVQSSGRDAAEKGPYQEIYEADIDAVQQTWKLLRPRVLAEAARLLYHANKVLCMGQGGSMIMAQEAAHLFSNVCPNFFAVYDSHMQAISTAQLTERDAVMYFSYSGATRDLVETLKLARARGARIILVTRFPKSPGAVYADIVLQCGSKEGPLQLGTVAARMAQLFLLDALNEELCRLDGERSQDTRERIAAALSDKHL